VKFVSTLKPFAGVLLCLAFGSALAEALAPGEDFLKAPDRIEWQAGGLYDGRFEDGTRFQIQLAYPRPGTVPARVTPFAESYWYPQYLTGRVFMLKSAEGTGNAVRLVMPRDGRKQAEESFSIALAPDLLSGSGTWTNSRLRKQMRFSLQRAVVYDAVVVQRPAPPEAQEREPERRFIFAAWFPVLGDADADAWIREQAGKCQSDLECANRVNVTWKSRSLLSLDAEVWSYNSMATHGYGYSRTRQYRIDSAGLSPLGLDAFVDTGARCAARIVAAIATELRARKFSEVDAWVKSEPLGPGKSPKFTPTPNGIIFQFNMYELGSYMQGSPSVFLTYAQLGKCLRSLPVSY
jgi:hypothetical protein